MPLRSARAFETSWPRTMPASSTVWCWSTSRSPVALRVRSKAPWLGKSSSMWSRKRMPRRNFREAFGVGLAVREVVRTDDGFEAFAAALAVQCDSGFELAAAGEDCQVEAICQRLEKTVLGKPALAMDEALV